MPRLENAYSSRARAGFDHRKEAMKLGVEFRHRRQDSRQHVDDDDGDDQPDKARADRMRQMIVFEQLVKPVP